MPRPLILGLDNPHSSDPRAALLPRPRGGAGHRLLVLSGMAWSEYRDAFERMNVCDLSDRSVLDDRTVIVLGREAWRRLGLPGSDFFDRLHGHQRGSLFISIPHPSGRSLFYNRAENRHRVRRLLQRIGRRAKDE